MMLRWSYAARARIHKPTRANKMKRRAEERESKSGEKQPQQQMRKCLINHFGFKHYARCGQICVSIDDEDGKQYRMRRARARLYDERTRWSKNGKWSVLLHGIKLVALYHCAICECAQHKTRAPWRAVLVDRLRLMHFDNLMGPRCAVCTVWVRRFENVDNNTGAELRKSVNDAVVSSIQAHLRGVTPAPMNSSSSSDPFIRM